MYQLTKQNHSCSKPADPFAILARDFFGLPFSPFSPSRTPSRPVSHSPSFDLVETEHGYSLLADLPGVSDDNLEITVHEGVLAIQATRQEQPLNEGTNFLVRELQYGELSRKLQLPKDANLEQIEAKLDAGVLVISIAKKEELKARKIKLG